MELPASNVNGIIRPDENWVVKWWEEAKLARLEIKMNTPSLDETAAVSSLAANPM